MLESVPAPLQAILWPLIGTVVLLALRRFLPNWVRRLLAAAFALASLLALRSAASAAVIGASEQVEIAWQPLGLFRMSPVLRADNLALLTGMTLAGLTAILALGIRGAEPRRTAWHGLILAALAGCLATAMATNLLTLALASALLDLALLTIALVTATSGDRSPWRVAVPGLVSTLLLLLSALGMDAQVGTASLLARNVPATTLLWMGVAALLRLLAFPLHPRGLRTPEHAATWLLPMGAGIYLLARVEALAPTLSGQPWPLVAGGAALLAGGLLTWNAGSRATGSESGVQEPVHRIWLGAAVHQTGYALLFGVLWGNSLPWPLLSIPLAMGLLAIWWDSVLEKPPGPRPRWLDWLATQAQSRRAAALTALHARWPWLEQWQNGWLARRGATLLPTVALLSLVGFPLTVGGRARWLLYADLLSAGRIALLLTTLVADALLAAGLWLTILATLAPAEEHRPRLGALLSLIALAIPLVVLGATPRLVAGRLSLDPGNLPGVSVWGLGLICVLPWLLGAWLARLSGRLAEYMGVVQQAASLDWLFAGAAWLGQRITDAVYWLSRVGEGEGWWGWALIILALGAILLAVR